jgi:ABC-type antimicrobial peptide transport system permease subunit
MPMASRAAADPVSFLLAAGIVVAVVLAAAWLPARHATRLAPTIALRSE